MKELQYFDVEGEYIDIIAKYLHKRGYIYCIAQPHWVYLDGGGVRFYFCGDVWECICMHRIRDFKSGEETPEKGSHFFTDLIRDRAFWIDLLSTDIIPYLPKETK